MIDESYDFNKTWYIKPTNFQKGLSLPEMSNELPVIFPLVRGILFPAHVGSPEWLLLSYSNPGTQT